jgi:hypothetical protein
MRAGSLAKASGNTLHGDVALDLDFAGAGARISQVYAIPNFCCISSNE